MPFVRGCLSRVSCTHIYNEPSTCTASRTCDRAVKPDGFEENALFSCNVETTVPPRQLMRADLFEERNSKILQIIYYAAPAYREIQLNSVGFFFRSSH